MTKLLLLLLSGAKFGKLLATGGSMILSVALYALIFGWKYAIGFVAMLFIHEMGHFLAARQRGLRAGLPMFIPFIGAWTSLKDVPRDAETNAFVGLGGPLLGAVGALGAYFLARDGGPSWLLAVAYGGFFLNLVNLMPLLPFDGGHITAALSPRLWLAGVPLMGLAFWWTQSPLLLVFGLLGLPAMWGAWKAWRSGDVAQTEAYFAVPLAKKWEYGFMYLGLAAFLAVMAHDAHGMLEVARAVRGI